MVSGAGEGIASPIARYTEALLWTGRALRAEDVLTPVSFTTLADVTWLVVLPLNRFLASTPFNRKVLLVSRWPLAQTGWLPKPAFAPVPAGSSSLTPGESSTKPVKDPVGKGRASISALSST